MQHHMFLGKALALIAVLLVAYQFYRGFRHSMHTFQQDGADIGRLSDEFVRALFGCMGHLAKSDGRVSEDEIRAARLIMHRLGLAPAKVRNAMNWFEEGERPGFAVDAAVRSLRRGAGRKPEQRALFVRLLLEVILPRTTCPGRNVH